MDTKNYITKHFNDEEIKEIIKDELEFVKVLIKDNKKLYPLGSVYKYQHVFDNFWIRHINGDTTEEEEKLFEIIENNLKEISCPKTYMGMYYIEGKYYQDVKKVIENYIDRHGGIL